MSSVIVPKSPEHTTMISCLDKLNRALAGQSTPLVIASRLVAIRVLAPEVIEGIQSAVGGYAKTSLLISSVTRAIEINPGVFLEFIHVLEEQGDWTSRPGGIVKILRKTYEERKVYITDILHVHHVFSILCIYVYKCYSNV